MAEKTNKYSLLLQNLASRQFYAYDGLENISNNHLWLEFDKKLEELPDGSYEYVTLVNNRDDVVYEFKTPILQTILHTEDGDAILGDLQPNIGLLQVGNVKPGNYIYNNEKTPEENNDNNTIFYYDGE